MFYTLSLHIITAHYHLKRLHEDIFGRSFIANFDPINAIHNWYSVGIRKRRPDYAAVGRDAEVLEEIIETLHDEIVGDEMIQEEL